MTRFEGYTKGPWKAAHHHVDNHDVMADVAICRMFVDRAVNGRAYKAGESAANAELCAAAPDLLRACEAMRGALKRAGCEGTEKYGVECDTCAALALADDVLGK